jgi:LPS sulfotransferase NodH
MYNYFLHLRTSLVIKKKEVLSRILPGSRHYTSFVILCEPRTGSTLLHTYLNFHPNIKSYGEVIREQVEKNHGSDPVFLPTKVFKPHGRHLQAIGLKLFYFYYDHPAYSDTFKEIVQQKDIKIIHLVRKDIFQLYVSLKIAQKTNIWSSSNGNSNKKSKPKIFIKTDEFEIFAQTYIQRQHYFKMLFKPHEVLFISYEDLTTNPQTILEQAQKFLGVKPKHLLSLLKKQNIDALESVVINYDDIRKTIDQITVKISASENA